MTLGNFTACPPRMLLQLAEIAEDNGNYKLRRVWLANYIRITDVRRR